MLCPIVAKSIDLLTCGCSCELRCAPCLGENYVGRASGLGTHVREQITKCTASRGESFRHVRLF